MSLVLAAPRTRRRQRPVAPRVPHTTLTVDGTAAEALRAPTAALERSRSRAGGWRAYLVLAAVLAPLCVPSGPAQTALLDPVNLAALAAFALAALVPGRRLLVPFALPMGLVAVGSLVASASAPSVSLAALSLAQDAYLFAWFLLVVNLLRDQDDVRAVRLAWVWTAVAVSLVAVGQLLVHDHGSLGALLGSRGLRPAATLYNPNMLADYLVLSVFVVLGFAREFPGVLLAGLLGTLGLGLLATKSNGGMIALLAGTLVWLTVDAAADPRDLRRFFALGALLATLVGAGAWLHAEYGLGDGTIRALTQHTFVGRMEHSSASRRHIWDQLERTYARSPLGIGPGNSGSLTLSITERERPDSYRSKEAHSDYLAYAIERGPLGLAGLLLLTVMAFAQVAAYARLPHGAGAAARGARAWTAAMAGALAASTVHSTVIEKLHFRHFWLLLALVCGSALVAARPAGDVHRVAPATPCPAAPGVPA